MLHYYRELKIFRSQYNYFVSRGIRSICSSKCSILKFHLQSPVCHLKKLSTCSPFSVLQTRDSFWEKLKKEKENLSKLMEEDLARKKPNAPDNQKRGWALFYLFLATYFIMKLKYFRDYYEFISWQKFISELLPSGNIEKIIQFSQHDTVYIVMNRESPRENRKMYKMVVDDIETLEEELRAAEEVLGIKPSDGVPVVFSTANKVFNQIISTLLFGAIFYFGYKVLPKSMSGFNPFGSFSKPKYTLVDPLSGEGKGVKFADVAGLREAKQEVIEFVDYLKRPDYYKSLGAKVPKGALLLGPPGCGKTLLAKAVATEANVPFLSMNGSEFIELIGGLGASRVRNLFAEARKISPCIVYIDEIDAIGRKRTASEVDGSHLEEEHTLNQLLVEMDGMGSTEGVVMLASTNRSEVLDRALLRPGRFDRHIMIDLPTVAERREIFVVHLKKIHLEHKPQSYSKRMASLTPGFSGADIANICNEAALHAARFKKTIVQADDLEYAVERVLGGTVKKTHAMSPAEKKYVAYHEAGRALVGWLSEHGEALLKISVVPRTNLSLGWTQFSANEQFLYSQSDLYDKMCMILGGRAAESLIFNRVSTKSEKDMQRVTKIAYAKIRQFGMNETVGLVSYGELQDFRPKPYSKRLASLIDAEARKLVAKAYLCAESVLRDNKEKLITLAEELLRRETLNYPDVIKLIGPPVNEKKKLVDPYDFDVSVDVAATFESPEAQNAPGEHLKNNDQGLGV